MKYITVTLNPAIDQTYRLDGPFNEGELNRTAQMSELSFSGKGINVSKALLNYGIDSKVVCLIGKKDGDEMYRVLREDHLNLFALRTEGRVRRNISVVSPFSKNIEINEPGEEVGLDEILKFFALYDKAIKDGEKHTVIISGSAPPGFRKDVYKRLTIEAKSAGNTVVLDADGELLKYGLEGKPDLIKPNREELAHLTGCRIDTGSNENIRLSALAAAVIIYEKTGTEVLCTLGESGSVFAGREGRFECPAVKTEIKRFKGAGDFYLARFLYERSEKGASIPDAMIKATEKVSEYLKK